MRSTRLKKIMYIALVGVTAYLLARFTKFPLFPAAPFLKMDFGEVPLLLSLIGGWKYGICALALKELLSFFVSGSNILGLIADFCVVAPFIVTTCLIAKDSCKPARLWASTGLGALMRMIICIPVNLIILKLQYGTDAAGVWAQLIYIIPFNLIKCLLDALCVIYLSPKLKQALTPYFSKEE